MIEHRTVTFSGADVAMTGHPDALDEIQHIVNAYSSAKLSAANLSDNGIYAGLDQDGTARLFALKRNSLNLDRIGHEQWISILDSLEAQMGELLAVCLIRYQGLDDYDAT